MRFLDFEAVGSLVALHPKSVDITHSCHVNVTLAWWQRSIEFYGCIKPSTLDSVFVGIQLVTKLSLWYADALDTATGWTYRRELTAIFIAQCLKRCIVMWIFNRTLDFWHKSKKDVFQQLVESNSWRAFPHSHSPPCLLTKVKERFFLDWMHLGSLLKCNASGQRPCQSNDNDFLVRRINRLKR